MASDRGPLPRVAWLVLLVACGPAVKPPSPPAEPPGIGRVAPGPRGPGGREVVVGEMCPRGAGGRPAVDPLIMRTVEWSDHAADIDDVVERGSVPRWVVFGVDGKLAGVFDTMGIVDIAPGQSVASGAYSGAPPCTAAAAPRPGASQVATRVDDPACVQATGGCGLAAGVLEHPDEPPEIVDFATAGACVADGHLSVDLDGDGQPESVPLAGVLDGIRGPAVEWSAQPGPTKSPCTPSFQLFGIQLEAEPDPGKPVDPKATVQLDVLGAIDLDGDGRKELVLALRFPTVRTIVVYSGVETPLRLQLVGEAPSFPR